jgi:hypothetical protein
VLLDSGERLSVQLLKNAQAGQIQLSIVHARYVSSSSPSITPMAPSCVRVTPRDREHTDMYQPQQRPVKFHLKGAKQ